MDRELGALIRRLRAQGRYDRSLIVVTADGAADPPADALRTGRERVVLLEVRPGGGVVRLVGRPR